MTTTDPKATDQPTERVASELVERLKPAAFIYSLEGDEHSPYLVKRGRRDVFACPPHTETPLYTAAAINEAVQKGSDWRETAVELPAKPGLANYEYVECLIFHRGEIKQRPWNCEHLCWDDEEHDDFFCDPTEPTHWMPLPSPPAIEAHKESGHG